MVTEYIGGDFNDASPAHRAASSMLTIDTVPNSGTAHDIARFTAASHTDKKAQAALGTALAQASVPRDATWKLLSYIDALMGLDWPSEEEARNTLLHSQIAAPAIKLLSQRSEGLAQTLDEIIAPLPETMRQGLLDRMLRAAANGGHTDIVRTLIAAGADATADGCRALLNALITDKLDCAHLLRAQGADLARMRETAVALKYDSDKTQKLGLQMVKLAASGSRADDFYYATIENTPNGFKDRFAARDRALALFNQDQPQALQQFLRGYLQFKRANERTRKADEGYDANVVAPLLTLLQSADDPAATLDRALDALPLRDRQTATQLLLRHICAKGMSPLIADAVIANGGEIGIFGNMPLSLAIRNGHSDLALHLVREHGANIGEAVMDGQINGMAAEGLQKLYTFMATQIAPQLGQAATVRFAKPSAIVRKP